MFHKSAATIEDASLRPTDTPEKKKKFLAAKKFSKSAQKEQSPPVAKVIYSSIYYPIVQVTINPARVQSAPLPVVEALWNAV